MTIQPVDELDVDAAIIFSDILVIPEAMGVDYEMVEKKDFKELEAHFHKIAGSTGTYGIEHLSGIAANPILFTWQ